MIYRLGLTPDDPEGLAEYYDSLSNSYDQLYGEEQSRKHHQVLTLVGNRKFDLLIDIGCGTGAMLMQVTGNYTRAIGTDISLSMLRNAHRKAKSRNVDFVRANCSALPFRSAVSDFVLSISMLKSDSPDTHFSELRRIAKTGGTLVLTMFHPNHDSRSLPEPFRTPAHLKVPLSLRESLYMIPVPDDAASA